MDIANSIEKSVELNAPIARVWQALTDYREFGEWFCVKFTEPFQVQKVCHGKVLYPGYEHCPFQFTIQKMQPENIFSFTWHPYAVDTKRDYTHETPTLVEFQLANLANGARTLLKVNESGFTKIPLDRRVEALRMNEEGWIEQLQNIKKYVEKSGVLINE